MHEVHVAYDGPDMGRVCAAHGLSVAQVVAAHTEAEYVVESIGFLPGFGYLAGLPTSLAMPRLDAPRPRVRAGSVGIGGSRTGVYPFASPGGWNLIGRTNTVFFDVARPRPALLEIGDRVRFVEADLPPPQDDAETAQGVPTATRPVITVLEPGLFTTVQDQGRLGYRDSGVPLSGAADDVSMRLANLLVGNPEDAAGLECTLVGPTMRFERDTLVAMVGAEFPGFPSGIATRVTAGTVVTLGCATQGCRGYVAIAGGVDVAPVLGSRSTLVTVGLGGFAGRPLAKRDVVGVGEREAMPLRYGSSGAVRRLTQHQRPCELRIVPSKRDSLFGETAWSQTYRATSQSNRMGVRLDGVPLEVPADAGSLASVAVFPGTVQVPPDGRPIILLADAQTTGGYPVCGRVIAADLFKAAQLRPGDEVRWIPATTEEAENALQSREALIEAVRESLR